MSMLTATDIMIIIVAHVYKYNSMNKKHLHLVKQPVNIQHASHNMKGNMRTHTLK